MNQKHSFMYLNIAGKIFFGLGTSITRRVLKNVGLEDRDVDESHRFGISASQAHVDD